MKFDRVPESGRDTAPASVTADERERLIMALLREPTLDKARRAVGMSLSTARRLKRTPEFQQEFRKARNEAFGDSMSHLQWGSGIAVATLIAILRGPTTPMGYRLKAANILLTHAAESRIEELDALIEHVESLSESNKARRRSRN